MANLTGTGAAALMQAQLASRYGVTARTSTAAVTATGTAPIQAQTVIINNYYGGSPMGAANSLFGR